MTQQQLISTVMHFRSEAMKLERYKASFKPFGPARVRLGLTIYEGFLVRSDDQPPDKMGLHLENGNTWWYPIECFEPMKPKECPPWMRRQIRKTAGIVGYRKRLSKQFAERVGV